MVNINEDIWRVSKKSRLIFFFWLNLLPAWQHSTDHFYEKGRKETEEIVEENKERDRERGKGMKVKKQNIKKNIPPSPLTSRGDESKEQGRWTGMKVKKQKK